MDFADATHGYALGSDDAGRTWQQNDGARGTSRPISAGSLLRIICIGPGEGDQCETGLGMPDVGGVSPIPNQPPLVEPFPGTESTAGGRYWAAGRDKTTGKWAISVTADLGTTWTTTPLDLPGEPYLYRVPWSVVEQGGVMYLAVIGTVATSDGNLLVYSPVDGTLASSDGGRTFTRASHQPGWAGSASPGGRRYRPPVSEGRNSPT